MPRDPRKDPDGVMHQRPTYDRDPGGVPLIRKKLPLEAPPVRVSFGEATDPDKPSAFNIR